MGRRDDETRLGSRRRRWLAAGVPLAVCAAVLAAVVGLPSGAQTTPPDGSPGSPEAAAPSAQAARADAEADAAADPDPGSDPGASAQAAPGGSHEPGSTDGELMFGPITSRDGSVTVDGVFDADTVIAGVDPSADLQSFAERLQSAQSVTADGLERLADGVVLVRVRQPYNVADAVQELSAMQGVASAEADQAFFLDGEDPRDAGAAKENETAQDPQAGAGASGADASATGGSTPSADAAASAPNTSSAGATASTGSSEAPAQPAAQPQPAADPQAGTGAGATSAGTPGADASSTSASDDALQPNSTSVNEGNTFNTSDIAKWPHTAMQVFDAWDYAKGQDLSDSSRVTVAILDTGYDLDHEDLTDGASDGIGGNVIAAYDASGSYEAGMGDIGDHGTHVAGIVGAIANNGKGSAGVSYNANLLPIQVFHKSSTSNNVYASNAALVRAYQFILDNRSKYNIRVANMSLDSRSTYDDAPTLTALVEKAYNAGVVTTCASGNGGKSGAYGTSPGDYLYHGLNVISINQDMGKSSSSNYNADSRRLKDISAPGSYVYSTVDGGGYKSYSGTSMASPEVAGVAALVFSANPSLEAGDVIRIIHETATDLGDAGFDKTYGYGLANAKAAVLKAKAGSVGDKSTYALVNEKGTELTLKYGFPELERRGTVITDVGKALGGSSSERDLPAWCYDDYSGPGKTSVTAVVFDESLKGHVAPTSMESLFSSFTKLSSLAGVENLDASKCTTMKNAFNGCTSVRNVDLSAWNTSSLASTEGMFSGCTALQTADLSGWATSKVTTLAGMFEGCERLATVDLSGWDTAKVTTMAGMFEGCGSLESLSPESWDTSNCADMSGMFQDCSSLASLSLASWSTAKVTTMENMFAGCSNLQVLNIAGFDTSTKSPNMTGFLGGGSDRCGVRTIVLGAKFKFNGFALPTYDVADGDEGRWVNKAKSLRLTAAELASAYNDDGAAMFGTWEWGVRTTPAYAAPEAKSDLVYIGKDQELVTVGSVASGGAMTYSLSQDGEYSADVPTASGAGTYHVWYRIAETDEYLPLGPLGPVDVTIAKAPLAVTALDQSVALGGSVAQGAEWVTCEGLAEGDELSAVELRGDTSAAGVGEVWPSGARVTRSGEAATANYEITYAPGALAVAVPAASVADPPRAVPGLVYDGAPHPLVSPGRASGGSMLYRLVGAGGAAGRWSASPPEARDAGDYVVGYCAQGDGSHGNSAEGTLSVTVARRPLTVTALDQSITYGGSIARGSGQVVCEGLADGDSLSSVALAPSTDQATEDGEVAPSGARVTRSGKDATANYAVTYKAGRLSIAKAAPKLGKAPAARSGLVYDGSAQALVEPGAAEGGELLYHVGEGEPGGDGWSAEVPAARDAGDYDVFYYVKGDSNHADSAEGSVSVTVARRPLTVTAKDQSITYGEAIAQGADQVVCEGLAGGDELSSVVLSGDASAPGAGEVAPSAAKVTRAADGATPDGATPDGADATANYEITYAPGRLSIAKAAPKLGKAPAAISGLVYDGSAQALVEAGSATGGELLYRVGEGEPGGDGWSAEVPAARDAGDYDVFYYVKGDSNHADSAEGSVSVTVARRPLTVTAKDQSVTYGEAIAQGADQVVCEGLAGGDELSSVALSGDAPAAGAGEVRPSGARVTRSGEDVTSNYDIAYAPGALSAPAPAEPAPEPAPAPAPEPAPAPASQAMHRLYNPYSGEHFYTASAGERDHLVSVGWRYEGEGWKAPTTGADVYRMYNPYAGDHHYTTSASERDSLVRSGWRYEGVGWKSGGSTPLYRQYNPYAEVGTHNYTTSKAENDMLVRAGWRAEGVGWYGA